MPENKTHDYNYTGTGNMNAENQDMELNFLANAIGAAVLADSKGVIPHIVHSQEE